MFGIRTSLSSRPGRKTRTPEQGQVVTNPPLSPSKEPKKLPQTSLDVFEQPARDVSFERTQGVPTTSKAKIAWTIAYSPKKGGEARTRALTSTITKNNTVEETERVAEPTTPKLQKGKTTPKVTESPKEQKKASEPVPVAITKINRGQLMSQHVDNVENAISSSKNLKREYKVAITKAMVFFKDLVDHYEAELDAEKARKGGGGSADVAPANISADATFTVSPDPNLSKTMQEYSRILLEHRGYEGSRGETGKT